MTLRTLRPGRGSLENIRAEIEVIKNGIEELTSGPWEKHQELQGIDQATIETQGPHDIAREGGGIVKCCG